MAASLPLSVLSDAMTDRTLHLILLPTEACNFRCIYCYESFQYKRMAPEVVRGVKALLGRRIHGLDRLDISWFGGEPLLASDIIEDVLGHVGVLRESRCGLIVRSDITTNAYLLSETRFQTLRSLGVTSYQIAFDGTKPFHDRKRILMGGKGTFDRIWTNVAALRNQKGSFRILVRLHIDHENKDHGSDFIDLFHNTFGDDPRFELFVRPLSRLGGPNDPDLATLGRAEAERTIEALRGYARGRGIRQGAPGGPAYVCYAAKGNSFLIRADGRINKCTVALEHPNNQVGRIHPDGTLEIDSLKTLRWMRGLRSADREELACPMRGLAEPVPGAIVRDDVPLGSGTGAGRG